MDLRSVVGTVGSAREDRTVKDSSGPNYLKEWELKTKVNQRKTGLVIVIRTVVIVL